MDEFDIVLRMIAAPLLLGLLFGALAIGEMEKGVFDARDRAYFGFASVVAFSVMGIGIWMLVGRNKPK